MGRLIASAAVWTATVLVVLLWLPVVTVVWAATAWRDPGRYAAGRWFRRGAIVVVALNPFWRFRTSGVRITDPRRPYIAIANHESLVDIFLLSHLPWEMKWISKEEVCRIPVMGWMMRMAGDICVRREDRRSRAGAVSCMRDRLAKRVSVMVFPEGTRSRSGELLPFRNGAFRVAIETATPILPIAVAGTRTALLPGSLRIGRARAEARVLEPIETAGMTSADITALRDRVHELIGAARAELQQQSEV